MVVALLRFPAAHRNRPVTGPLSVYLHIPFCRARCAYCAFTTYAGLESLIPAYVGALVEEIRLVGGERRLPVHTLYFGGGTPSLLTPGQLGRILNTLQDTFSLSPDAEISLEANPGTVTRDGLQALRSMGVNRLSLGIQSVNPDELKLLGRIHSLPEARAAFSWAREAGFDNVTVDLIYGLPNQTLAHWQATVEAVLAWEPDHLSLYALAVEDGTPLARRIERGEIPAPDPDLTADMYAWAGERLESAGLMHYEISNWAVPGYECRHNLQYWHNGEFLGFGVGAHGAMRGCRYWNVAGVEAYIAQIEGSGRRDFPFSPALEAYEVIDKPTAMAETMILGLRLIQEGVRADVFEARFGCTLDEMYGPVIKDLTALGLMERTDDGVWLTRRAYFVSNQVFVRFLPDES